MSEHHRSASWKRTLYKYKPRIAATLPSPCIECGRPVLPDQPWHVAHRVAVVIAKRMGWSEREINALSNLGPAHARCNTKAGGRLGSQIRFQKAKTRDERRLQPW